MNGVLRSQTIWLLLNSKRKKIVLQIRQLHLLEIRSTVVLYVASHLRGHNILNSMLELTLERNPTVVLFDQNHFRYPVILKVISEGTEEKCLTNVHYVTNYSLSQVTLLIMWELTQGKDLTHVRCARNLLLTQVTLHYILEFTQGRNLSVVPSVVKHLQDQEVFQDIYNCTLEGKNKVFIVENSVLLFEKSCMTSKNSHWCKEM